MSADPPRTKRPPSKPPKRLLLLGNGQKKAVVRCAAQIRTLLQTEGAVIAREDLSGKESVEKEQADFALVLGGDGAILRAVYQMGKNQVPVLGVNLGRLGFLAEVNLEEFLEDWPRIKAGDFTITRHVLLDCTVVHDGKSETHRAMNEAVVSAGSPFKLTDFELTVDGEKVATYSGDGLIISTPIGSTAHSLAAGGPILMQALPAVVITPICPHALAWRPLVESADRKFELVCPNASTGATLIIDGHIQIPITPEHRIHIRRSPIDFQLARVHGRTYYQTLVAKLHWGSRPRS